LIVVYFWKKNLTRRIKIDEIRSRSVRQVEKKIKGKIAGWWLACYRNQTDHSQASSLFPFSPIPSFSSLPLVPGTSSSRHPLPPAAPASASPFPAAAGISAPSLPPRRRRSLLRPSRRLWSRKSSRIHILFLWRARSAQARHASCQATLS
jgi:hypothetical protein